MAKESNEASTKESAANKGPTRAERRRRGKNSDASTHRFSVWFVLPVLLVLCLRFFAVSQLAESPFIDFPQLEDGTYLSDAAASARQTPGAPDVLPRGSAVYTEITAASIENGEPRGLSFVQIALEGLTTLLLCVLIGRRFGTTAGVISGVVYALDPLGAFFAARLIPTTWATCLFLAAMLAWDQIRPGSSPLRSLAFGVLTAAGFALSPLLFVFLAVAAVVRNVQRKQGALTHSALALVPLIFVATTLLVRHDSIRGGGPILSWGSGVSMYQSSNMDFGGTPRSLERPQWRSSIVWQTEAWEALGREGDLYDLQRHYASTGLKKWIEQPIDAIGVLLVKAAATVGAWPVPDALSASFLLAENAPLFQYGSYSFALWLGLAAAGWYTLRLRRRDGDSETVWILTAGIVVVALTSVLGVASAAARQPVLPLLAGLGGCFLAAVFGRLQPGHIEVRSADAAERPSPIAYGLVVLGAVLSVAAGTLSPTHALSDESEQLRHLGRTYSSAEKWAEAMNAQKRAVVADSTNLEARVDLARLYQRDGLVRAAEEQLLATYRADSTHVPTLISLSGFEQQRGNINASVALMSRVVNAHPNNPLFLNELGQLMLRIGQVGNARGLFLRALEIKPDYRVAQSNLETVVKYERDTERQLYPDDMQLAEDDPLSLQIREAVAFMQAQNWEAADSLLKVTEQSHPNHVLPHFMRAGYHARRGQSDAARASLELCNQIAPCRIAIVERLAGYYVAAGQIPRAQQLVRDCLAQLPEGDSLTRNWNALRDSLEVR